MRRWPIKVPLFKAAGRFTVTAIFRRICGTVATEISNHTLHRGIRLRESSTQSQRFSGMRSFGWQERAKAQNLIKAAAAPAPSMVTGVVRTSEGSAVPGATVRLVSSESGKIWLSWTDESGKFQFPQIAAGHYHVEARQLGFVQASLEVQIPTAPTAPFAIVMRVATLAELSGASKTSPPNGAPRRGNGQNSLSNSAGAPTSGAPTGGRGNGGGRGQQAPAGVTNAIREGLGGGGFEQTDLTGEGTNPQASETNGPSGETAQAQAALSTGTANANATSDSFLLQGTVGQGFAGGGPGRNGLGGIVT